MATHWFFFIFIAFSFRAYRLYGLPAFHLFFLSSFTFDLSALIALSFHSLPIFLTSQPPRFLTLILPVRVHPWPIFSLILSLRPLRLRGEFFSFDLSPLSFSCFQPIQIRPSQNGTPKPNHLNYLNFHSHPSQNGTIDNPLSIILSINQSLIQLFEIIYLYSFFRFFFDLAR